MIDLDSLLAAHDGILLARRLRPLKSSLSRWCRAGRLARLLPGVYVHPASTGDVDTRVRAVCLKVPDAVLCDAVAARFTAWPSAVPQIIEVSTRTRRRPAKGFRFVRRPIPPEDALHRGGIAVTSAALTAVDSASHDKGSRIDDLLRTRRATLEGLASVLQRCPGRVGNRVRRRVLRRSRSHPWSIAEREYHDLFDRHRIRGWVANHPVMIQGRQFWLDIAFPALRVAIEIDGYEHHSSRAAFTEDRARQNALVIAGWRVLRFTWGMLAAPDDIVATVRAAIHPASTRRSSRPG
ncbi:MAG: DUF559 domain-containing protein [Propionibacteriaceae bacterium]|nr:DUF559 domain-containing protein [Propionibacteriaceae bacterium]